MLAPLGLMSTVYKDPDRFLKRLMEIEAHGRERAADRNALPIDDRAYLEDVYDFSSRLGIYLSETDPVAAKVAYQVRQAASVQSDQAARCLVQRKARRDCEVEPLAENYLEQADRVHRDLSGRRCTWLLGQVKYRHSAFLNDLTACFHRTVEIYSSEQGKWKVEGKCRWRVE